MADFDERSGIVPCRTLWGLWYQTLDEVSIEVNLEDNTRSKDIRIKCTIQHINVTIADKEVISGTLFNKVLTNGLLWTVEKDVHGKLLRIVLQKQDKTINNTWNSLLKDDYKAEDWLFENMRKKAALEKISLENPDFDLSGTEMTGHYATGGPDVPS